LINGGLLNLRDIEVVFSQKSDLVLPGWRATEGMNVQVDARHQRWVAEGPVVAAPNIFPLVSAAGF
jgi:hypothetical protein